MRNPHFCHKTSDFNGIIKVICCIVLISRKWVGLDIFNSKWGDKYRYLNVARTEKSRWSSQKNLVFTKSKRDKNLFYRVL